MAAIGVAAMLVIAGAWLLEEQPVRIEGWKQARASITPRPDDGAASSATAEAARAPEGVAPATAVPPQGTRSGDSGAAAAMLLSPGSSREATTISPPPGSAGASLANAPDPVTTALAGGATPPVVQSRPEEAPSTANEVVATSHRTASSPQGRATGLPGRATPTLPAARVAAPAPRAVAPEKSSPREICAGRTLFALYRCMQAQCAQRRWSSHAQCERLRKTDEVD
jgi:hypothetical protein